MNRINLKRGLRKKFVVYTPDYTSGSLDGKVPPSGEYKVVNSWYQVVKLCKKPQYGTGSEVFEDHLTEDNMGNISFWNTQKVWDWY